MDQKRRYGKPRNYGTSDSVMVRRKDFASAKVSKNEHRAENFENLTQAEVLSFTL